MYDVLSKSSNVISQVDDKRTAIDLSLLRDEFQATSGKIRWIDTRYMLADPLAKECSPDYVRYVMRTSKWSILEEGSALQKKLLERQQSSEDEPETNFLWHYSHAVSFRSVNK